MQGKVGVRSSPGNGSVFWFLARFEIQPAPPAAGVPHRTQVTNPVIGVAIGHILRQQLTCDLARMATHVKFVNSLDEALTAIGFPASTSAPAAILIFDQATDPRSSLPSPLTLGNAQSIVLVKPGTRLDEFGEVNTRRTRFMRKPPKWEDLWDTLETLSHSNIPERARALPWEPSPTTPPRPAPPQSAILKTNQHLQILVAEDNPVNQVVILRMLQRMGLKADIAANGLEVLEAIQKKFYHLILMDCQIPELDGYETTRRLIADDSLFSRHGGQRPIIIAVTANALEHDRQKCADVGMDDYLSKPMRLNDLRDMIAKWEPRIEFVEMAKKG